MNKKEIAYGLGYAGLSPFVFIIGTVMASYLCYPDLKILIFPGIVGLITGAFIALSYLKNNVSYNGLGLTFFVLCTIYYSFDFFKFEKSIRIGIVFFSIGIMYLPMVIYKKRIKKILIQLMDE